MSIHVYWAFWTFVVGVFSGVCAAWIGERRRTKGRLNRGQEMWLREALYTWADAYDRAGPAIGSRNTKRREVDLFEACSTVGLSYIRPPQPAKEET